MEKGGLNVRQIARRLGADAARTIVRSDGERSRKRTEFLDQRSRPEGGVCGPGGAEEGVQEGSAPFRFSRS